LVSLDKDVRDYFLRASGRDDGSPLPAVMVDQFA
jgi:hypothetical protein